MTSASRLKLLVHLLAPLPVLLLLWSLLTASLGPDPAEVVVRELGFWGMSLLWACLAMTPLKKLFGQPFWIAARRSLGLWAFFYVTLHLMAFSLLWAGADLAIINEEIRQRPYILLGLSAWILLIPLALTSTRAARRNLGVRWIQLHRTVYIVAFLALAHLLFIAKLDYVKPVAFTIVLIFLFFVRFFVGQKPRE